MHLTLVLLILVIDLAELLVTVLLDLGNGHLVAINQLLVVLMLLIDLRLTVLHLLLVVLFLEQDLILVVRLDFLDRVKEVFVLTLFLSLQFGELFGVIEHSTTVFVSLLLDFVLLLVQELSPFNLLRVLRLLNLSQERLLLVLSLLHLAQLLVLLLGDRALLRLHVQLDVDFHVGFLLVLTLCLQLLLLVDHRIDLELV